MRGAALRWLSRRLERHGYEVGAIGEVSGRALRRRLFRQLADLGFDPVHVVDVGAHRAAWSRDARDFFAGAAFTLIEPQLELAPELDRFCADTGRAQRLLAGAGACDGELELTITPADREGSSFAISETEAARLGLERRTVPLVTLDTVCRESEWPAPRMVKIDAEGFELEVLAGATTLLGSVELFFVELPISRAAGYEEKLRPDLHRIVAHLRDHGYEPYDVTDLIRRPSDRALGLVEAVFARREGELRTDGW